VADTAKKDSVAPVADEVLMPAAVAPVPLADTTQAVAPAPVAAPVAPDTTKAASSQAEANSTSAANANVSVTVAPAASAEAAQEESAKDAIIENPLEFGIVSAVFLATVLLIIFTGKD
jgi:hypothetical protein